MMTKQPIVDRAEVAIDFPDKYYLGSFTRHSAFEAAADADGVLLRLTRGGPEKRQADIHLHYHLFADMLDALARSIEARHPVDDAHRAPLLEAVRRLARSLET
jgi:hypothetical protein